MTLCQDAAARIFTINISILGGDMITQASIAWLPISFWKDLPDWFEAHQGFALCYGHDKQDSV